MHISISILSQMAGVAPEVDLRECALHSHLQKANKAEPTLALKPRGDVTRNPKPGYYWHQIRACVYVRQKSLKKMKKENRSNILFFNHET